MNTELTPLSRVEYAQMILEVIENCLLNDDEGTFTRKTPAEQLADAMEQVAEFYTIALT